MMLKCVHGELSKITNYFYYRQISRQLSMIITDEIASADAIMLLLLAVSNHCIFYFFYSCVELEFLFLAEQDLQVQSRQ